MHAWEWRDTLKCLQKFTYFQDPTPTPFTSLAFATIHVWQRRKHSRIFVNLYLFIKHKTHFIYPIHICHDPCVRVAITPSHDCEIHLIFWTQKPLLTTFTFATICAWELHDAFAYLHNSICFLNPKTTSHRFHICHEPRVRVARHSLACMSNFVCVLNPKTNSHHHHICHNPCMRVTRCSHMIVQSDLILKLQNNFSLHSHLPRSMREKVTRHSCVSVNYSVFEPNNHFPLHSHLQRSMYESDATLWYTCIFFFENHKPLFTTFSSATMYV